MAQIHATAVIEPGAKIGADVEIGPFCVVGPEVELDDRVRLHSHVVVEGKTAIGAGCEIYPFSSIGHSPQDQKYRGETSRLTIGEDTVIREHVTINPGTEGGGLLTSVGSHCLIMVGAHIAHDCRIGDHVILVNNATLAGHVTVEDHVIVGGLSAIHQFVRIGAGAFIGGMSGVERDVIPFGMAIGNRAVLGGLNLVGLKRRKLPREQIHGLRQAYRALFAEEGTLMERCETVEAEFADNPLVAQVIAFIRSNSDRSFCVPAHGATQDQD
ncbi:acyl-ACP--UDP-N-acetylglucosamine O-acyltransferase [Methyloligella sp. 2.7D]|uniref:acyl-ACP--UDP-N-acetylglucosamine O-acyltransferase n=1 Tax=unclassified Methyloligella TaxID=2625955 RepID=UPI00157DD540|nr:acyl-ACP--UDP-N-acetylglucosamine O-acyltransferase [Methyloligella sp. GL2]QKP77518.1 acyl-ACP--UDP-N-acetylglucosamine O-acyltransferase [Methyloligella sp. GL2]